MDELEKRERCKQIGGWDALDNRDRGTLLRALGLRKPGDLGDEQRKRARKFLGQTPPTSQKCFASSRSLTKMRVHQETVPGCDHREVPIDWFLEPWHLWCAFCNVEALDARKDGRSWHDFPELNQEVLQLAEQIAKSNPALGWTRSNPRAHLAALSGTPGGLKRERLGPLGTAQAVEDDDPARDDPPLQRDESGFVCDSNERTAIEMEAMRQAEAWLIHKGYDVQDFHKSKPYDYVATRDGVDYYIEVKGTTSRGTRLFLTRGEVEHVRAHPGRCILIVVSGLRIHSRPDANGNLTVLSGKDAVEVIEDWRIADDELQAINYRYTRSE